MLSYSAKFGTICLQTHQKIITGNKTGAFWGSVGRMINFLDSPVHKLEPMDLTQTVPYFCKAQKLRSDSYLWRVAKDEEKNNILWRTITTWNSKLSVLELSCVGTLPCAFMCMLSMAASLPRAAACNTQKWPGTFQLYVFAVIEPTPRLFQIKSQLSYMASACSFSCGSNLFYDT